MTKLPRITAILIAALLILFVAAPAFAENDPPSRVMRLKYMSGQVSFQPGGVDDWVAATINRPLTTADRVWTDKQSRAELNMGTASLRMDSETSLTLSNVSDNTVQVELDQGVLNIHVRRLYGGEIYEVDTPNVAFTLLKAGDYRFEVDPNGDTTTVIVRRGKGEGNGNGRGVQVESGEMARFEHGNTMMHTMARAPRPDGFDDWCQVRSEREDKSDSFRYVSDDVIGYEDLDDNGYWRTVPTYGSIWVPRTVVVGWAPYRYGHWAWIEPWGWTWVDDAAWGFAPFHYGRWVYSSYGWGWCPGPRHYRPIYSPALVAWFGGPHWGVGLSFGGGYGVGWVPLGWGEPYYPYYRVSRNYVREVNIRNTHITNINYVTNNYTTIINNRGSNTTINNYVNVNHGATTVPGGVLEHGRPVARSLVAVNDHDLKEARFNAAPEVAPKRGGVLGGREDTPAALPPASMNRHVITKMTPPERPDKFENRQPYIERNHGMAVDSETMAQMKRNPAPANNAGQGPKPGMPAAPPEAGRPTNADRGRPMENDKVRPAANADNGKSVNADNNRPGNVTGRQVPRPPETDRRVINLEGPAPENAAKGNASPAANANANENGARTSHYVPRPPSDRRPASGAEGAPASNSMRQDSAAHTPAIVVRPADGANATAPENRRSPVFDRNNNAGGQGKSVDAEVTTPRSVPRPPEGSQVRSDAEPGTFNQRSAPDTTNDRRAAQPNNERRSTPDVSERRSAPDNVERRSAPDVSERHSAPQPPAEQRAAPEKQSPPVERQPQKEERHSAPPAEKQNADPAKKTSSLNYMETPRFAESSRSSYVPKPPYAGQRAVIRETSYSPRESSYSPRERAYSARESSYVSHAGSYSPRYESPAPSYSRSAPSYSRSSSYSGTGGARSYSAARSSGSSVPGYSSSHAASGSGGGKSSSASRGASSSHGSSRH
jgi:hypothetical protein